jgi:hypothetical protein
VHLLKVYASKLVEGEFSEVRVDGVLQSRTSRGPTLGAPETPRADGQRFVRDAC